MLHPLDLAPYPDRPARALFAAEVIAADLDRLAGLQQDDGGWIVDFRVELAGRRARVARLRDGRGGAGPARQRRRLTQGRTAAAPSQSSASTSPARRPRSRATFARSSASVGGRPGAPGGSSSRAAAAALDLDGDVAGEQPRRRPGVASTSTRATSARASGRATAASVKLATRGARPAAPRRPVLKAELALQPGHRAVVDERMQRSRRACAPTTRAPVSDRAAQLPRARSSAAAARSSRGTA